MLGESRVPNNLELVGGLPLSGHGLLEPTSQVIVVPPRFDDQHPAAGGQAGVRRGLVPVPQLVTDQNRVRLLLVLDRVVDDQAVADENRVSKEAACFFHLNVIDLDTA